jgi:DNA-binding NtrC family response regulator
MMGLLSSEDWDAAKAIAGFFHVNPFVPERVELERKALGSAYKKEEGPVIRLQAGEGREELLGNVPALNKRAERFLSEMRGQIEEGQTPTRDELLVYEDLVLFCLYNKHMENLEGLRTRSLQGSGWDGRVDFWRDFQNDFKRGYHLPGHELPSRHDPQVILAWLFQNERAFTQIYSRIIGGSMPVARLRAAIWESIFTHDIRRYIRSSYRSMTDVSTLIVGPSGTGKELVARAIALSCFIRFDPGRECFELTGAKTYVPVNLAALPTTLIESELFGHVKGSFTGAVRDRKGLLEHCGEDGAVFLDEIGELDGSIQVKLLRVLESREFQKLGETKTLKFEGKIIAATNRDLIVEMRAGRFRHDLYYRVCADQLVTPSLAEQLADRPQDLPELVRFIAMGVFNDRTGGSSKDVDGLTSEVIAWIDRELGRDYAWPGNFRELNQCVRNIMIRGRYRPPLSPRDGVGGLGPIEELLHDVRNVELTKDKLLGRYYALAYSRSDENWTAAGRQVGVDWRTVRDKHDPGFLEKLRRA